MMLYKNTNCQTHTLQTRWYSGFGYATCGELIQGSIDGEYFLINFPINYCSQVQVKQNVQPGIHVNTAGEYPRLIAVLTHFLSYLQQQNTGITVNIHTAVPRSKGMASSTSELCAALCATAKVLQAPITADLISHLITTIEPSDGTYYPGIIRYNPLTGTVYESFGHPPSLECLVVDTGGTVNTEHFDRQRAKEISLSFEPKIRDALSLLRTGFAQQAAHLIANAATISAQCNQKIHHKSIFSSLLNESLALGALGVNCAHTGTVCGVLFNPQQTDKDTLRLHIESAMGSDNVLGCYTLISGGL